MPINVKLKWTRSNGYVVWLYYASNCRLPIIKANSKTITIICISYCSIESCSMWARSSNIVLNCRWRLIADSIATWYDHYKHDGRLISIHSGIEWGNCLICTACIAKAEPSIDCNGIINRTETPWTEWKMKSARANQLVLYICTATYNVLPVTSTHINMHPIYWKITWTDERLPIRSDWIICNIA